MICRAPGDRRLRRREIGRTAPRATAPHADGW